MILNEFGFHLNPSPYQKVVIIGAGGFAKEIYSEEFYLSNSNPLQNVYFFDNIRHNITDKFFGDKQHYIINSFDKFESLIKESEQYTDWTYLLGVGNPLIRKKLYDQMSTNVPEALWGKMISDTASIGIDVEIGIGCTIMQGTIITADVRIGKGSLLNTNCTVAHDCTIGDFVEISPAVNITGHCKIGDYCSIGTNATLIPKVRLGKNVIVGAGAVVTKDVPDNSLVVGVPAKVIKELTPIK